MVRKLPSFFLLILALMLGAAQSRAQEPVEWYIQLANPSQDFEPLDEFEIVMGIRNNTTGILPAGYNVFIVYPTADLEYVGVATGSPNWRPSSGAVESSTREFDGRTVNVTRRAFFAANVNDGRPLNPNFGRIRFRIRSNPSAPQTFVWMELFQNNPDNWLVGTDGEDTPSIPFVFQFNQTNPLQLDGVAPTATPTPTPSPSPSPSPTPSATPSATPSPTPSQTPTPSASPTPSPEFTPTPSISPTPSPEPTPTPIPGAPVPLSPEDGAVFGAEEVFMRWEALEGAGAYVVRFTRSTTQLTTEQNVTTLSLRLPAPNQRQTVEWQVRGVLDGGVLSPFSQARSFTFGIDPTASPSPTPSPSPTASPTATASPTPSISPSPTPSPSPSPSATPSPSPTPSPVVPSPTPPAIRLALTVDVADVLPAKEGDFSYRFTWQSDGGDPVVERGPKSQATDTLREGEEGVTFNAGETWTVRVVAVDRFDQAGEPATGTFLIEDAGQIRFTGWVLD